MCRMFEFAACDLRWGWGGAEMALPEAYKKVVLGCVVLELPGDKTQLLPTRILPSLDAASECPALSRWKGWECVCVPLHFLSLGFSYRCQCHPPPSRLGALKRSFASCHA